MLSVQSSSHQAEAEAEVFHESHATNSPYRESRLHVSPSNNKGSKNSRS